MLTIMDVQEFIRRLAHKAGAKATDEDSASQMAGEDVDKFWSSKVEFNPWDADEDFYVPRAVDEDVLGSALNILRAAKLDDVPLSKPRPKRGQVNPFRDLVKAAYLTLADWAEFAAIGAYEEEEKELER